jgi:hypothetical protein
VKTASGSGQPLKGAPMSGEQKSAAAGRGHVRYLIAFMVFAATTVNYADRASLSIVGPAMQSQLHIDPITLGYIFSAFGWSYVIAQLPGGWLLDRFGSRAVYSASILLRIIRRGAGLRWRERTARRDRVHADCRTLRTRSTGGVRTERDPPFAAGDPQLRESKPRRSCLVRTVQVVDPAHQHCLRGTNGQY